MNQVATSPMLAEKIAPTVRRSLPTDRKARTGGRGPERFGTPSVVVADPIEPWRRVMTETTTDHETIRRWAESKGGKPAAVDRTHKGGDVGIVRIMFPQAPQSEHENLVEISWDEFFEEFDKRDLALLYDQDSMFSKIVGRDTAERRQQGEHGASRH